MPGSWEYYRIFYFVARYQNFTRAADALLSSQPAVSRSMQLLEQELGCLLFIRSKKGVQLTPEGELLYHRVAPAYESLMRGEEELSQALGLEGGSVSISVTETALHCFLLERLALFHGAYPGVRLKIFNQSTPQALDYLASGRSDLAVVTSPAETAPPLSTRAVRTFSDLLVGGAKYAHLGGRAHRLSQLAEYPLVALSNATMTHFFLESFYASLGLPFRPDIELASAAALMPVIQRDLGIGFVPEDLAMPALAEKRVFLIPLQEKMPERQILIVRDTKRSPGAAAGALLRVLQGAAVRRK